jgi:hypothetical protein
MHILPAMLIGIAVWIILLCVIHSAVLFACGPFVVSGVALALTLLPVPRL